MCVFRSRYDFFPQSRGGGDRPLARSPPPPWIRRCFPAASIVLDGDFTEITDQAVVDRNGLLQIVYQPTRGLDILDRVFVSCPMYIQYGQSCCFYYAK